MFKFRSKILTIARKKILLIFFSTQVPGGSQKKEMLENLDRVPTFVQQLQFTVKNTTVGKAATFTKVSILSEEDF